MSFLSLNSYLLFQFTNKFNLNEKKKNSNTKLIKLTGNHHNFSKKLNFLFHDRLKSQNNCCLQKKEIYFLIFNAAREKK